MKTKGLNSMHLSIESLTDMFHKYPLKKDTDLKKFYEQIKTLSSNAEKSRNIFMLKTLLRLMTTQMAMFSKFIQFDYNFWHEYFNQLTNIEDTSELAIGALNVFYKIMGKLINEDASNDVELILRVSLYIYCSNLF